MLTEGICSTLKFSTNWVRWKWLMHSSSCTACNSIDTMPLINHKKHHLQNHPAGNIWSCRTIPQISYCAHLPTAISLPSGAGIGSGVQDRKESGKVMGTCNLMSQLSTFYNVFYSFLIYRIPSAYILMLQTNPHFYTSDSFFIHLRIFMRHAGQEVLRNSKI